ncbi:MAG: PIG-L family deacetylase, partial [Acidobacteria bacterium]|nr:PIG-L family deacetylase [Acidobacteriota bacterium]
RAEDRRFGRACGLIPHNLGFPDRPVPSRRRLSALVDQICDRLVRTVGRLRPSLLVSPFPYGHTVHPHHLAVFRAAERAMTILAGVELVLVDDVPYSRIPFGEEVILNGTKYVPLVLDLSRAGLAAKTRLMRRCYPSQMCPRYFRAVSRPTCGDRKARPGESLWVPAHLKAAFADRLRDPAKPMDGEHIAA